MTELPYVVGALYNRRTQIHGVLGGQRQGGISTPKDHSVVIAFTGEAGQSHGYHDFWDDEGVLHYFGEGQAGDMKYAGGNRAIDQHQQDGKKLILFQMMGHGKPYRYLGEFVRLTSYLKPDTPATRGPPRTAMVFRLAPISATDFFLGKVGEPGDHEESLGSTVALQIVEIRKKQSLFRRRLLGVEKQCRLTAIQDLRFLRASHIKPWSDCANGAERTDGNNGLLLSPHADLLFDRGWISFGDQGNLIVTSDLPSDVRNRLGMNLRPGRNCGPFTSGQQSYLNYHRSKVYEQRYKKAIDPINDLLGGAQLGV